MRCLVLGAGGLLGRELMRQGLAAKHEMHGTERKKSAKEQVKGGRYHLLDLLDDTAVLALLDSLQPQAIFYCAGYHPVDACETDPSGAMKMHAVVPATLAAWCAKKGAWMGYLSTDYVFDGKKAAGSLYTESDESNPQSIYAKTKRSGERVLLAQGNHVAILRTSVVYGAHPTKKNFVLWLLDELRAGHAVKIVDDQFSTPTYADDLASAMLKLAEKKTGGLFHAAGSECLSRYEFAKQAAKIFGLDSKLISPVKTAQLKQAAARPKNGCLLSANLESATGVRFRAPKEALADLKSRAV